MSISGISSNSGTYQATSNNLIQLLQNCQSRGKSLQSGDPPSAQQLFAQLHTDGGAPAGQTPSSSNPSQSNGTSISFQFIQLLQDCQSLGKSLQSGNPPSAQELFAQLQTNGVPTGI